MWKILIDKNGAKIGTKILNLKNTLLNGQSFNWKIADNLSENNINQIVSNEYPIEYIGYIEKKVILLKEDYLSLFKDDKLNQSLKDKYIFYKIINEDNNKTSDSLCELKNEEEKSPNNEYNQILLDYFQLEVDLVTILNDVGPKLPENLRKVLSNLEGVRIIKQEKFECIISFICSSNNNILRIKKMLNCLRENYGEIILDHVKYGKIFAFPSFEKLVKNLDEDILRNLGFGYRAKYIINSLKYIERKDPDWLENLEKLDKPWEELINLNGVGRKVADCISLFSLKKHQIVPLDIHMIKFYNETVIKLNKNYKKIENLSNKVYDEVSKIYSDTFGEYAGWVHSVFYLNRIDKANTIVLNEKDKNIKTSIKPKIEKIKIEENNNRVIYNKKRKADIINISENFISNKKEKKK